MTERLVEGRVVSYSPQLAKLLGSLAAACVLQQIHFWMPMSTKQWGGHRWVYKTYEALGAEVGISKDQARKAVKDLREVGLIEAVRNPYRGFDQTLWFRAVYEEIEKFVGVAPSSAEDPRPGSSTNDVAHNTDQLVHEAAGLSPGPEELASQPAQYQERTTGEDQHEITRGVEGGSADVKAPGVGKEESAGGLDQPDWYALLEIYVNAMAARGIGKSEWVDEDIAKPEWQDAFQRAVEQHGVDAVEQALASILDDLDGKRPVDTQNDWRKRLNGKKSAITFARLVPQINSSNTPRLDDKKAWTSW